jgi:hypothetical protein
MKLSQTRADKLSKPGRYHDGFGLYFQVTKQGSRSWVFRYERAGVERWMGLGPCRLFTLRDARARANACQQKLWDGIDPITVAHEERAARARESASLKTFRQAADAFYDQHHKKWTSKTYRGSFHQRLNKYVHPKLGSLPVARISKPLIIETLTPIWNEKNSTAIKVLGLIECILDFAKVSGWRDGENPAMWKGAANSSHARLVSLVRNNQSCEREYFPTASQALNAAWRRFYPCAPRVCGIVAKIGL